MRYTGTRSKLLEEIYNPEERGVKKQQNKRTARVSGKPGQERPRSKTGLEQIHHTIKELEKFFVREDPKRSSQRLKSQRTDARRQDEAVATIARMEKNLEKKKDTVFLTEQNAVELRIAGKRWPTRRGTKKSVFTRTRTRRGSRQQRTPKTCILKIVQVRAGR